LLKMHKEKKPQSKKKSTVSEKVSVFISLTVELFLIAVFFLVHFYEQTPAREIKQGYST
jgi:hypothetical protein